MERRNFAIELTTEPLPPTTAGMNQTHEEYPIMEMTLSPMLDAGGISPVQLAYDWSRVWRLLIMLALCVIGSIGNVYMISSVMIEDHLKKKGNTFIANVALADFLISGFVIPLSVVVLLAGMEDPPQVCQFQWFVAILCFVVTVLSFTLTAAENYTRLCLSAEVYSVITSRRVTVTVILVWIISALLAFLQQYYRLGPDYCAKRVLPGIIPYQAVIAGMFLLVPVLITIVLYLRIAYQVKLARTNPDFKPSIAFTWDYSLMQANMYSFLMFLIFWSPFVVTVAVTSVRNVSAYLFYNLAWFALSKSCFNNLLYCVANRHFRNAYINLFHYCCCKTTVTFSRRTRTDASRPSGDVRVHIIPGYNMYSYTSPQRGRDMFKPMDKRSRPACNRLAQKDIYEL
ncbi:unnamed protein product [Bemisia tabaci]|uniref:G-protein coupled receptors family 1 profile domain-containing protein n=2 Tax=Bemisia tabaci TaxID=7038 RepID=A0A9P0AEC7_BEMTA|nr:unnamed protein product [Bemisia tabaci]